MCGHFSQVLDSFPEDLPTRAAPQSPGGPGEAPDGRLLVRLDGFGAGNGPLPGGPELYHNACNPTALQSSFVLTKL